MTYCLSFRLNQYEDVQHDKYTRLRSVNVYLDVQMLLMKLRSPDAGQGLQTFIMLLSVMYSDPLLKGQLPQFYILQCVSEY